MIDFVRLNNRTLSAKSVTFNIVGVPYSGIVACKYSEALEKEHVYDADKSGGPIAITEGKYTPEDTPVTFLKDVFVAKFQPQMAALSAANGAPGSWGQPPPFTFAIQYVEIGLPPCLDLLAGCEIVKAEDDYAEGIQKAVVVVTLKWMTLTRNGLVMYNPIRSFL